MSTAAAPTLPWSADDPAATHRRWRDERPGAFWDDHAEAWLVHTHAAASAVLRGPGWSSHPGRAEQALRATTGPGGLEGSGGLLVFLDPPDHTRIRRALQPAFGAAAVADLAERVRATTAATLGSLAQDEELDLMATVARPLPLAVVAEWFDLGIDGAALLEAEAPALVRLLDADADAADVVAATRSFALLLAELVPLAQARRARPGADLLSWIAADPDLALHEVVAAVLLLAVAGHETTAKLVGNAVARSLATGVPLPGPADGAALAEVLRLDAPVQVVGRVATRPHDVAGARITAGQRALVVVAAANRDPAVYAEPDRFDPDRFAADHPPAPPLTFGLGRHHCLGAHLARLELAALLPALAARRPVAAGPVSWDRSRAIHGPRHLPVALRAP